MTDPKTLPLYNKLKESKVNSRNVLSAQPSWVNRRSPPLLPGRRPAERAPASHGRPSPPPAALSAGGRRAGGSPLATSPSPSSAPPPYTRYLLTFSHLPEPPGGGCWGSREAHFSIPSTSGSVGCPERCRGTPPSCPQFSKPFPARIPTEAPRSWEHSG